jgi:hypothetical protein
VKTIEILDDMGHRMELGQIPEEDVERACGVIDSLAITGEAVTPVLTAQLRAFLAQSGIRLQGNDPLALTAAGKDQAVTTAAGRSPPGRSWRLLLGTSGTAAVPGNQQPRGSHHRFQAGSDLPTRPDGRICAPGQDSEARQESR